MKRKIQFQYGWLIAFLMCAAQGFSQINYTANFDDDENNWDSYYFYYDDAYSCSGTGSYLLNIYGWNFDGDAYSPLIGTSNGSPVTITYSYKIVEYDTDTPVQNSDDWGYFEVYWAPSAEDGPFNLLQTVDTSNHVVSANCATKTITFTPPAGTPIYLALYGYLENSDLDINIIFDNITVTQAALVACAGTPAASTTVASSNFLCNGGTTTLSLSNPYLATGLTYQWQASANNTTFTNVATGGTSSTYSTTQAASTWYRAAITCTASGEVTYSAPVQVLNSGLDCPCDVDFDGGVEPITLVNFAGINNATPNSVNGTPGVQDFSGVTPGEVTAGETYPIIVKGNTAGEFDNFITVYFDWNQNGDFTDEGEAYEIGSIFFTNGLGEIQAEGDIEVPADALAGFTYMRVFKSYDAYTDDPCSAEAGYGYGQAEDYIVNVTVLCTTPAPEAEELQIVCSGSTIGDLSAEGFINKWYAAATGGEPLTDETVLTETTYYVSQTPEGGCESEERTAVTVDFSVIPPPVAEEATQVFCAEAEIGDLEVEADGELVWYTAATGGTVVTDETALVSGTTYYAAQFVDGCESATRTPVMATINVVEAPVATSPQSFSVEEGETISIEDIEVDAEGSLTWYETEEDAINNTNPLDQETYTVAIGETVTLYAVQTIGECVSEPTAVTLSVVLGSDRFTMAGLQYYPNPVKDVFSISYKNTIDVIQVYNLVGQCVARQQAFGTDAEINLGNLAAGSYMVKVQSGTETGIIKIIKQ